MYATIYKRLNVELTQDQVKLCVDFFELFRHAAVATAAVGWRGRVSRGRAHTVKTLRFTASVLIKTGAAKNRLAAIGIKRNFAGAVAHAAGCWVHLRSV